MDNLENQKLINFLNQLLSNYFVLYVKLHRYHWYIKGENFFVLHDYFEQQYLEIGEKLDEVAERIIMIGGRPLATMSKYLKETTLEEANADDTEEEIILQLIHDFEKVVMEIRSIGIPLTDEYQDESTNDLLIGLQRNFEKELWMLRAYQREN